jgi:aminoglycoside phosphotransferase (APT) family kinase protein
VAKAVKTWPGYAERYADKLEAMADYMPDRMIEVSKRDDTAFNVLLHGDLWVNNMLFRYSADGPVDVRFLDYQLLHFSSPAIDLQYFFSTSLCEDVRENHVDSLMKVPSLKTLSPCTDTASRLG